MPTRGRVLVTGASGFVGAQVVEHLLLAGYAVRGTARSNKAAQLRKNCPHPDFDVAVVDDLVTGDFSEPLRGVDAVIHVASPIIGREDPVGVAIGGTMNIIRQAHHAKVFKVTLLSSFAAVFTTFEELADPERILTDKDWRKVTKEDLKPDTPPIDVYAASKTFAERAAWEFADSHPELDLITILPPFIYGPLARPHALSSPSSLSTDEFLYQLLARPAPSYPTTPSPHAVDIRDVAIAAVSSLAVTKPKPCSGTGTGTAARRRVLLYGGSFTWTDAVRHLARARPALRGRLVDAGAPPPSPGGDADADGDGGAPRPRPLARIDTSVARDVLGMKSFVDWRRSVEDAVDSILARESEFAG